MKRRALWVAAVVGLALVALCVVVMFMTTAGPSLEDVKHLLEPRVTTLAAQKMLVVEATGEPNAVGGQAFDLLLKTYFKLKGVPKGPKQPAPRARWPLAPDTPKEQWIGRYAMPVPESIEVLPEMEATALGLRPQLQTWTYGRVAEILHIGRYEDEEPTIRRLLQFINDSRYAVVGEHEEEYLKGPGMFGPGNPEKYLTIIRYPVRRADDPNDGNQTATGPGAD
jgi:hypothetical protein